MSCPCDTACRSTIRANCAPCVPCYGPRPPECCTPTPPRRACWPGWRPRGRCQSSTRPIPSSSRSSADPPAGWPGRWSGGWSGARPASSWSRRPSARWRSATSGSAMSVCAWWRTGCPTPGATGCCRGKRSVPPGRPSLRIGCCWFRPGWPGRRDTTGCSAPWPPSPRSPACRCACWGRDRRSRPCGSWPGNSASSGCCAGMALSRTRTAAWPGPTWCCCPPGTRVCPTRSWRVWPQVSRSWSATSRETCRTRICGRWPRWSPWTMCPPCPRPCGPCWTTPCPGATGPQTDPLSSGDCGRSTDRWQGCSPATANYPEWRGWRGPLRGSSGSALRAPAGPSW